MKQHVKEYISYSAAVVFLGDLTTNFKGQQGTENRRHERLPMATRHAQRPEQFSPNQSCACCKFFSFSPSARIVDRRGRSAEQRLPCTSVTGMAGSYCFTVRHLFSASQTHYCRISCSKNRRAFRQGRQFCLVMTFARITTPYYAAYDNILQQRFAGAVCFHQWCLRSWSPAGCL